MMKKIGILYVLMILMLSVFNITQAQEAEPEEFPPLLIDLSGTVEGIDEESGSIILNGVTITLDLTSLPEGLVIEPGAVITVSGELLEDGTLVAQLIVEGGEAGGETPPDGEEGEDGEGSQCGFSEDGGESTTGDDAEEEGEDGEGGCHPVLVVLSEAFETPYEELQALREENYGIGEIARTYLLAEAAGVEVSEITELRDSGLGWGQIMKEYPDVHPSQLAPGSVIGNGRGHSIREDIEVTGSQAPSGSGGGNGNGNGGGNGNGNANGNGGGNGNGNGGGNGNGRGNG